MLVTSRTFAVIGIGRIDTSDRRGGTGREQDRREKDGTERYGTGRAGPGRDGVDEVKEGEVR